MENIYKVVLEETLAGYWDWNIREKTEYLSPSFKAMFGYEDDELENKPESWQAIVFPEDLKEILTNFEEHVASKGKKLHRGQARYKHKDGSTVWVMYRGSVVEWDGDEPVRMVGCHIDITKQKKTELELRATQELLTQTNEAARVGGWEVDLETFEPKWTKITAEIHEIEGDGVPKVEDGINYYKKGESRDKIIQAFDKLVKDGTPYDLELQLVTAKGNEVWVRTKGYAEFKDGKCVRAYGTFQDIDEQKRTQQKLERNEKQLTDAFEHSAIGMAFVGLDGRWLRVNRMLCDMLGYSEQELKERTFQDVTHPDDLDNDLDNVQSLLEGSVGSYQMEKRYFHKYGHVVWVLLSVSLLRDEEGKPLHFISQIEEITQRKKTAELLKQSEAKYRAIFENIQDVYYQTDYNGVITEISPSIYKYSGFKREEIIGKSVLDFYYYVEDREKLLQKLKEKGMVVDYEIRMKNKSHKLMYVSVNAHAVFDSKGNVIGTEGSMRDITDRKTKEHALRNTLDVIGEQNTRLYNFAHIVTHNLRSYSGNLGILLQLLTDEQNEEEKETLFSHLKGVSKNLSETIEHLGEIVSMESDIEQQKVEIDLHEYVEHTIETLAADISHSGAVVNNNIPTATVINYSKAYIESVLLNFLSNAIKYRSRDRQAIINFFWQSDNGHECLVIEDNGKGIDLDRHGKDLFGMYNTFHGNDDAKGIGLFITKNQIEAMGGSIKVDSKVDVGTKFTIYTNKKPA